MEIKIKPLHGNPTVRCSIHLNGRLTFSLDANAELGLNYDKGIAIGQNAKDPNDKNLYMSVYDRLRYDAFQINSSGLYHYINTKALFLRLGYDFKNKIINFDIVKVEDIEGGRLYRLEKWEKSR